MLTLTDTSAAGDYATGALAPVIGGWVNTATKKLIYPKTSKNQYQIN